MYEYPADDKGRNRQMIFEQRDWSPYVQEGDRERSRVLWHPEGILIIGHSVGWKLFGPRMEPKGERTGGADLVAHHQNFLDSIRGEATPNADIHVGHRAATIVHLGNIGARLGGDMKFDPEQRTNPHEPPRSQRPANQTIPRALGTTGDLSEWTSLSQTRMTGAVELLH